MAKEAKITGYTTKIKSELEAALGLTITGKPRSPKVVAPVAPGVSGTEATSSATPSKVVAPIEYIQIKEIREDNQVISLILRSDIPDLQKLKEQAQLPVADRTPENDDGFDYIDLILKKRKRHTKDPFIEYAPHEIIRFSIVVYMY